MDTIPDQGRWEARKKPTPQHVLVLAHSSHGHLAPAFYLAMEIARQGIIVTFVASQRETSPLIAQHESELRKLKLLRLLTLLTPPVPAAVRLNQMTIGNLLRNQFEDLNIRDKLIAGSEPPTCVVASMFLLWAKELALDLQVPRYTILGSGAVFARFVQAIQDIYSKGDVRLRNGMVEKFNGHINVAGLPGLGFHDLPSVATKVPAFFRTFAQTIICDAHGVLVNTFHDLEGEAMDALREFKSFSDQKFYAVGPLDSPLAHPDIVDESEELQEDCLQWLNSQPTSSVIYVCFGSKVEFNHRQIKEVALGLETSKRRFFWVLPKQVDSNPGADFLPLDFEARVADSGYIVRGWVPQKKVLSHPSIGAFLTHCGWNSCLEAVSRGIPMIALPIASEQHMNCRYVVDTLKIAAEIRRSPDNIPEPNAVEAAIRQVTEEEEGRTMKDRVQALRRAAASALEAGGSTVRERHEFCEDIKSLDNWNRPS